MAEAFIMRRGGDSSSSGGGKFAMGTVISSSNASNFKLDISKIGFVPKQVELYRTSGSYEAYDVYGLYWSESGGGYVNGTGYETSGVTVTVKNDIFRLNIEDLEYNQFLFYGSNTYHWIAFENECDILSDAASINNKTSTM